MAQVTITFDSLEEAQKFLQLEQKPKTTRKPRKKKEPEPQDPGEKVTKETKEDIYKRLATWLPEFCEKHSLHEEAEDLIKQWGCDRLSEHTKEGLLAIEKSIKELADAE
jgi:hypothetical protein